MSRNPASILVKRLVSSINNSSNSRSSSSSSKIGVVVGVLAGSGALYSYYSSKARPVEPPTVSLPPIAQMLSDKQVAAVLKQAEESRAIKNQSTYSVIRMDLNSVASNDPCEDYHCEGRISTDDGDDGFLIGIVDGHGGRDCAATLQKHLLPYVAAELKKLPKDASSRQLGIKTAMEAAFERLDADIVNGAFLGACLDPPDHHPSSNATFLGHSSHLPAVKPPSPIQSRSIASLFSPTAGKWSYSGVLNALRVPLTGACAIVAFVHHKDVYVACTGDSRAVIGRKVNYSPDSNKEPLFIPVPLSADQTVKNSHEMKRLFDEHPGEEETVVARGRVLGGLMPTRAFGDARYKWPLQTLQIVASHLYSDGRRGIPRNYKTPPYVTAKPVVTHYERNENDKFLVLATDGLWDELSNDVAVTVVANTLGKESDDANAATSLIEAALGGGQPVPNKQHLTHILSIPNGESRRYRDDVTVNVVFFDTASDDLAKIDNSNKNVKDVAFVDVSHANKKRWNLLAWQDWLDNQQTDFVPQSRL